MGLTKDKKLLSMVEASPESKVKFTFHHKYHVALYKSQDPAVGQIVSPETAIAPPVLVDFSTAGYARATLTSFQEGDEIKISPPKYH